jgi:hypothetical protein
LIGSAELLPAKLLPGCDVFALFVPVAARIPHNEACNTGAGR